MSDIIRLLPDSVANQIAAGEVVQRPASAVKELLENAIDSGATAIQLVIRDAGKTLIQVTDNGCGMSERDARMCFERHATSKIQRSRDLLAIRTLGFRGEALASIASIAQVELRSRKQDEEIGTQVIIEGTELKSHKPVTTPAGTSILVKNLFFNVPARRNFLKSNTSELKYIQDEFFRVALVNPDVSFTFYNQDRVLYQLGPGGLRQRIVSIMGPSYSNRLIPVEQQTNMVNISGFIGKPEFAKKTRGEQYFFANGRFIRNPYLHHAVEAACTELIPRESYPTYFLYMELDPANIDVNIHPTKTEINFTDSKSIYAIMQASVKQSIGKFNLTTRLDFDQEQSMDIPPLKPGQVIRQPQISIDPEYNPFEKKTQFQPSLRFSNTGPGEGNKAGHPEKMREAAGAGEIPSGPLAGHIDRIEGFQAEFDGLDTGHELRLVQIGNSYILREVQDGIEIIDQQLAHERILYEEFYGRESRTNDEHLAILPVKLSFNNDHSEQVRQLIPELLAMGFEVREFGNNDFLLHTVPADLGTRDFQGAVEQALEHLRSDLPSRGDERKKAVAISLARSSCIRRGTSLKPEEMRKIYQRLKECLVPDLTPSGKPTGFILTFEELNRKFKNKSDS
jgi:DNA mismatch repair protein MutL